MATEHWYFCLTPDWPNRQKGLFLPNTNAGNDNERFWYKTDGTRRSPDNPPPLAQFAQGNNKDEVSFAIGITTTGGRDDFGVDKITVVSTVRERPLASALPATQASPFKKGNESTCTKSGPPTNTIVIGGRTYETIGPFNVHKDHARTDLSAYELSILADCSKGLGATSDFSYDPEMDVDNS